ncbi:MAG: DUF1214 domain-containing protein [Ignavibacteriae bacterium]|nr:DUF1214 domain-containing protein [Ignavibacteriota bacterium]
MDTKKVIPENFIRAETDRMFYDINQLAGGINKFYHIRSITPLDKQTVVRMNKDVLYSGGVVDAEKGATVTFPEMPDKRYASILVIDNDHYCPFVIYEPGKHKLPQDTKYMFMAIRIQVFNPKDESEIAMVNKLKDQFIIESNSADDFTKPVWEKESLDSLRAEYEKEFSKFASYPADWMGPKGTLNEETRQYACAGAWGLFPNKDATYINYNGGNLPGDKCYSATYSVPDVGGFWSITLYGNDGYMKSDNSVINESNVKYNDDKTFTVHFGPEEKCPGAKNRLDITDGWNFLMRAYLPGESVLNGSYKVPEVKEVK